MITVACVWVQANVPYSPDYVVRLRSMVRRWLPRAHEFVCLTDCRQRVPDRIPFRRVLPVPLIAGWWAKIELFRPGLLKGRVLYLDLDVLVVDSLEPIVDYPSPFALVPDAGTFEGRNGLAVVKRFNSSVMVWDADVPRRLYEDWSPIVARRLWGDQDWIGEQMPEAGMMPVGWFPRLSSCPDGPPQGARVILSKKPKNTEAAQRMPWFREAWA